MENNVVTVVGGLFVLIGAFLAIIRSMVAPLETRVASVEKTMKDDAERARLELDKSERGLKDLTNRAETIIRQTVEDVDNKLRREAELIEEKTRIQFSDMQRQIEQLRQFSDMQRQMEQLRIELIRLKDGPERGPGFTISGGAAADTDTRAGKG